MQNDYLIRQAEPEDAEAILSYLKKVGSETDHLLFGEEGIPFTVAQEAAFIDHMKDSVRSTILLAEAENTIIGIASLQGTERERIAHRGEIAISVLKKYWGSGIGASLIVELIKFAESRKMEILSLEVRSDNERAIRLYEKFGFVRFGTYRNFFKIKGEYHDADYMNLYLEGMDGVHLK